MNKEPINPQPGLHDPAIPRLITREGARKETERIGILRQKLVITRYLEDTDWSRKSTNYPIKGRNEDAMKPFLSGEARISSLHRQTMSTTKKSAPILVRCLQTAINNVGNQRRLVDTADESTSRREAGKYSSRNRIDRNQSRPTIDRNHEDRNGKYIGERQSPRERRLGNRSSCCVEKSTESASAPRPSSIWSASHPATSPRRCPRNDADDADDAMPLCRRNHAKKGNQKVDFKRNRNKPFIFQKDANDESLR
uniref:Uncharacterized protein n=1 Tax=Panagrellus redivivus TaxID=6233 RepID=A0A7E4W5T1_PANRE